VTSAEVSSPFFRPRRNGPFSFGPSLCVSPYDDELSARAPRLPSRRRDGGRPGGGGGTSFKYAGPRYAREWENAVADHWPGPVCSHRARDERLHVSSPRSARAARETTEFSVVEGTTRFSGLTRPNGYSCTSRRFPDRSSTWSTPTPAAGRVRPPRPRDGILPFKPVAAELSPTRRAGRPSGRRSSVEARLAAPSIAPARSQRATARTAIARVATRHPRRARRTGRGADGKTPKEVKKRLQWARWRAARRS
jgi:hypothetical protein